MLTDNSTDAVNQTKIDFIIITFTTHSRAIYQKYAVTSGLGT